MFYYAACHNHGIYFLATSPNGDVAFLINGKLFLGRVIIKNWAKECDTSLGEEGVLYRKTVQYNPYDAFGQSISGRNSNKNSGYGRELSCYGIKEFVNIKSVWVDGLKTTFIEVIYFVKSPR